MRKVTAGVSFLVVILIASMSLAYPVADSFRFPLDNYDPGNNDFGSSIVYPFPVRHLGEDAKAKAPDNVYAVGNGKVMFSDFVGGFGGVVLIEHNTGTEIVVSLVGHLNSETLKKTAGQEVAKGEFIGQIGTSSQNGGWSEHLHFAIRKGQYISSAYYYYYDSNQNTWRWTWAYLGYTKMPI